LAEAATLPPRVSLRVWRLSDPGAEPLFESRGKWLHPLFELTEFLESHPEIDPKDLILRDRIVGRAAAFLILRLGIRNVGSDIVSRRALSLFSSRGLSPTAGITVDRIDCKTEDLLAEVEDFDQAWRLLSERRAGARKTLQRSGS